MSTYIAKVKHPETGMFTDALMIDDYFGNHCYGLQFAKEQLVRDVDNLEFDLEFSDEKTTTPFSRFYFFRSKKEDYGSNVSRSVGVSKK